MGDRVTRPQARQTRCRAGFLTHIQSLVRPAVRPPASVAAATWRFMVPGYLACMASRRTIRQDTTTTHCHAMPYTRGCSGYICQLKTARWYMSDLEAPAGRSADLAYVIVMDDIAARIASGELRPGARLLAERDLARRYGVAYGTIRRAMKELRARGLISSVQGRGTFVARREGPPPGALSRGGIAAADGHLADHPGRPAARRAGGSKPGT